VAFKNKLVEAFSAGEAVTNAHLDDLYESTRNNRIRLLEKQAFGHHSSDNYNRDHPIQVRDDHGSVYHVDMVYNFVQARVFVIPKGTTIKEKLTGLQWTVSKSYLPDYWTCHCEINRVTVNDCGEEESVVREVCFPDIGWDICNIPGDPTPVALTYIDQSIPPSARQKVPLKITPQKLLFGNRDWMSNKSFKAALHPHDPREHTEMMRAVYRLKHFFMYNRWCTGEKIGESSHPTAVVGTFNRLDKLLNDNPSIKNNVTTYQLDCLKYWNVTYDAVDRITCSVCCHN
jgi:hypothetical protein